jgi:histidine phosphotransferase ChpT
MRVLLDFRVFELLAARLCHELVSPIGAINNGVELLGEDDPDFVKEAMTLIGQSGRKAAQRLQFYRFAYGTLSTGSATVSGGNKCRELAEGLLDGSKVACDWPAAVETMPIEWQKLACNMLVLAAEALPRGGRVTVTPAGAGLEVAAEGDSVMLPPEFIAAVDGGDVDRLTPRTVHAYFTGRLAETLGARLAVHPLHPGRAIVSAMPAG